MEHALVLRLEHVKYTCLPEEETESLLDNTTAEVEAGASSTRLHDGQRCPWGPENANIIGKHPHAQTATEEGAEIDDVKGLL